MYKKKIFLLILIFIFLLGIPATSFAKTKTLEAGGDAISLTYKKPKAKKLDFSSDANGYVDFYFTYKRAVKKNKKDKNEGKSDVAGATITVSLTNKEDREDTSSSTFLVNEPNTAIRFDVKKDTDYQIKIDFPDAKKKDVLKVKASIIDPVIEIPNEESKFDIVSNSMLGRLTFFTKGIGKTVSDKILEFGPIYLIILFGILLIIGFIIRTALMKYGFSFLRDPLYKFKSATPGGHPIDVFILLFGLCGLAGIVLGRLGFYDNSIIHMVSTGLLPFISVYLCFNKTDEGHLIALIGAKLSGLILFVEFLWYIVNLALIVIGILLGLGILHTNIALPS